MNLAENFFTEVSSAFVIHLFYTCVSMSGKAISCFCARVYIFESSALGEESFDHLFM